MRWAWTMSPAAEQSQRTYAQSIRQRVTPGHDSRRIPTQRICENRKGTTRRFAQDEPNIGTTLAKDEPHQWRKG
jgi:hypothetical protein